MRNYTIRAVKTPLVTRVVMLNRTLVEKGRYIPHGKRGNGDNITVDIRRCYLYPLLKDAGLLFKYALRQLRGNDYLKRSRELIEEILAQCYLIFELKGWSNKTCAEIALICGDIKQHLSAVSGKDVKRMPESSNPSDEDE